MAFPLLLSRYKNLEGEISPGGGGIISPSDITGLRLWLKADTGTYQDNGGTTPAVADGDVVGLWQDQSGNGYHVSQATAINKPLLKLAANGINNRPTILFDGSNDRLSRTVANWLSTDSSGSIFLAYRTVTLSNYDQIFSVSDTASSTNYLSISPYLDATNKNIYFDHVVAGASDTIRGSTTILIDTTYIMTMRSNGSVWTARINGANETITVTAGENSGDWFADLTGMDEFTVGGLIRNTPSLFVNAKISEIVVYNSNLTGTDLSNVETYLNTRYAAY